MADSQKPDFLKKNELSDFKSFINDLKSKEAQKSGQREIIQQKEREQVAKMKDEKSQHVSAAIRKQRQEAAYNSLSLLSRRIYQALTKWCDEQPDPIPNGILELHFNKNVLSKMHFEHISGDIDSTMNIKKLKGSEKLKEMLLVFKRGKDILLDLYTRDYKDNIFTFMFINGKIQSHKKVRPEIREVINCFTEFYAKE